MSRILAGLALCWLLYGERYAHAQSRWNVPEIARASDALKRGDCKSAWETAWPLAKTGNKEARYFLWVSMFGRVLPPSNMASREKYLQHLLTLAAYAAVAPQGPNPFGGTPDHKWARKEIPNLVRALNPSPAGEQAALCYEKNLPFQSCLDLSIKLGVIPSFEDYVDRVEADERESGSMARCK